MNCGKVSYSTFTNVNIILEIKNPNTTIHRGKSITTALNSQLKDITISMEERLPH